MSQHPGIPAIRADATVTDQRLLRGTRARRTVARRAVDIASLDGLGAVSLGRLATDLGLSKSGVQTLFRTKERLQLATVELARELFVEAVVRPARAAPPGAARLRALLDRWISYASAPLFAGGCFRAANLAELDSHPGPVRDALFRDQTDWRALLAAELRHAVATGEIAELDSDLTAFQLDAILCATNTALRLGDESALPRVRQVLETFLRPPQAIGED